MVSHPTTTSLAMILDQTLDRAVPSLWQTSRRHSRRRFVAIKGAASLEAAQLPQRGVLLMPPSN